MAEWPALLQLERITQVLGYVGFILFAGWLVVTPWLFFPRLQFWVGQLVDWDWRWALSESRRLPAGSGFCAWLFYVAFSAVIHLLPCEVLDVPQCAVDRNDHYHRTHYEYEREHFMLGH